MPPGCRGPRSPGAESNPLLRAGTEAVQSRRTCRTCADRVEDALNCRRPRCKADLESFLLGGCVPGEREPEPGGIHERESAEIDDQPPESSLT
jgi:hypothetical protein